MHAWLSVLGSLGCTEPLEKCLALRTRGRVELDQDSRIGVEGHLEVGERQLRDVGRLVGRPLRRLDTIRLVFPEGTVQLAVADEVGRDHQTVVAVEGWRTCGGDPTAACCLTKPDLK